jgi:hypothetical protein
VSDHWRCQRCAKAYPQVGERRTLQGHLPGICAPCSIAEAERIIDTGQAALGWYVDRLKAEVKAREADLREEARYAAAMAEDAEWERRR